MQPTTKHINAELGAGIEDDRKAFDELVTRVKSFNFDGAELSDVIRIVQAAKLVSEEAVRRYEFATRMEKDAKVKMATADLACAVGDVVTVQKRTPFLKRLGL